MKSILFLSILILFPFLSNAQSITGTITNEQEKNLIGANVYWINTNKGTSTNAKGFFKLLTEKINDKRIIISYIGYQNDTVKITNQLNINVKLKKMGNINTVNVKEKNPGIFISSIDPIKTEVITQKELTKSACCDLAGCFNTQSSVKSTTTNIVTHAKELKILGLSGAYNQILIDGMPLINGLSYTYGISGIPGTLVNTIYVSKGANSILQGYESITGQINVILKEPDYSEKLLFNLYTNSFLETQLNINYKQKFKKWRTLLSGHITQPGQKIDHNSDSFLDIPLLTRYLIYNKWKYGNQEEWGLSSTIGVKFLNENRIGGQVDFNIEYDQGTMNNYGQTITFTQPEAYTKTNYKINNQHNFVFIASAFNQKQKSYFGTTLYEAKQNNIYANIQHELTWNTKHNLKTGFSYRHQYIKENIDFLQNNINRTYAGEYIKQEQIPGVFTENTFNWKDSSVVMITGLRFDSHNDFGNFLTPRCILKYDFNKKTTARISAGSGWRTINLFSENIKLLASSKDVIISDDLEPEKAINYGANLTHNIYGNKLNLQLTFDFYKTQFLNQIFPDYNIDPIKAYINNFTGKSISNAFQAEIGLEFSKKIGLKLAYNYIDVYRIINEEKITLPFNPKHRIMNSLSFQPLNKKWHLDLNFHYHSKQTLPETSSNPIEYQIPKESEPYSLINAQFTKTIKKTDIYIGCENILNFTQEQPILSWQNPFGQYFDTSTSWGPSKGRELYLGIRFKIK